MIVGLLSAIHLFAALIVLVLSIWLLLEVLASFVPHRSPEIKAEAGPVAVLIPAHNEGEGLAATLIDIKGQLRPIDRLLVVADNCTDNTAEVAERHGAEVLIRQDAERRGKGYALQHGLDHLRASPPSTVFMTDADCLHSEGMIIGLGADAEHSGSPMQALYLMEAGENAPPSRLVAAFAWLLMNDIRMRGLRTLAGTTRLVGAGVSFPWSIAESLALGSSEIVEDLALTVTLAAQGQRVSFAPHYVVTSTFPDDDDAARVQRARWEHGSLGVIRKRLGHLFVSGFSKMDPWRIALALNVAIPPLTVMALVIISTVVSSLPLLVFGETSGFLVALTAGFFFAAALLMSWFFRGQTILPFSKVKAMVSFIASKFGVYGKSARASSTEWTRTPRDGEQS